MASDSWWRSGERAVRSVSEHGEWQDRAVRLARSVLGRTSPNPAVGAVVVREGEIVGEGATRPAGGAHAEVTALAAAGERARGATLYTTLEPCSHHGRTPPCTEAIINAGIAQVHYAVLDPNPVVMGAGHQQLAAEGIEVIAGAGPWVKESAEINEAFFHWIKHRRPFIIAKWAMSLDGRIATRTGDSRWISGEESRRWVHEQRNVVDAILVGSGTVLADDPSLTTRLDWPEVHHPLRVVLDARGRTPASARLVTGDLPGKTLIATTTISSTSWRREVASRGVEVLVLPAAATGGVDLDALLTSLAERGILSVVVEGGASILGSLVEAQLINKYQIFVAPIILGGRNAPGPIGGSGVDRLMCAWRLSVGRVDHLGPDLLLTCYPDPRTEIQDSVAASVL